MLFSEIETDYFTKYGKSYSIALYFKWVFVKFEAITNKKHFSNVAEIAIFDLKTALKLFYIHPIKLDMAINNVMIMKKFIPP